MGQKKDNFKILTYLKNSECKIYDIYLFYKWDSHDMLSASQNEGDFSSWFWTLNWSYFTVYELLKQILPSDRVKQLFLLVFYDILKNMSSHNEGLDTQVNISSTKSKEGV